MRCINHCRCSVTWSSIASTNWFTVRVRILTLNNFTTSKCNVCDNKCFIRNSRKLSTYIVRPPPPLFWLRFWVSQPPCGWVRVINIYTEVAFGARFFNFMTCMHECYISNILMFTGLLFWRTSMHCYPFALCQLWVLFRSATSNFRCEFCIGEVN